VNYKHNTKLTPLAKQLRKNMTKEERHLWYDFLRDYPARILRQKVIDGYIADFYCHAARLVIELDGSQHYETAGAWKDQIRTEHLQGRELSVIRIPNNAVNNNFSGVCEYLNEQLRLRIGRIPPPPAGECDKGALKLHNNRNNNPMTRRLIHVPNENRTDQ